jgi:hypothetical protein
MQGALAPPETNAIILALKAQTVALQNLGQQRNANSTKGNKGATTAGAGTTGADTTDLVCWACNQKGHMRGDPVCTSSAYSHGLDLARATAINTLCKDEIAKYPSHTAIPDGQTVLENGTIVATFCTKCNRFTKGKSMHNSATHAGRGSTAIVPAAPGPQANVGFAAPVPTPPAPALPPGPMIRFAGVCAPVAGANVAGVPAPFPIPDPVSAPMPAYKPPDYDFGGMQTVTHNETFHDACMARCWSSDTEEDTPDDRFLDMLGKE